jgi:hypothetical protein
MDMTLPRWLRAGDLANTPQGHGFIVDFERSEGTWTANVRMGDGETENFALCDVERVGRDHGHPRPVPKL